ncbi:hypothetical protein HaLaN_00413 [Haematococcus lacustris]|uniref:Uncharacterized protein n=1 Tax=Haematococcus lacustris TaxID=44745 RepID=A0A699YDE0_HAELA|nr:hypothetical protein HaLaN_00413 [Haematococcus lacustris]
MGCLGLNITLASPHGKQGSSTCGGAEWHCPAGRMRGAGSWQWAGLLADLAAAPQGAVVILHAW